MAERYILLGVAVVAFTLGVVALGLTARAALRRGRGRQRQVWVGVIFQGILIVVLFAVGAASLLGAALTDVANRPAPAPSGAVVAYIPNTRVGASPTIQGVSARDGTTLWTRTFTYDVQSLLRPTPDIILADRYPYGVCALRSKDGVVLWCHNVETGNMGPMATDGARVYIVVPAPTPQATVAEVVALDVQTGVLAWQTPVTISPTLVQMVVSGDGLVVMASVTSAGQWEIIALSAGDGSERWAASPGANIVSGVAARQLMVVGGNVIFQAGMGPLTALREQDGATAWSGPSPPAGATPGTMLNEATSDGTVVYVMSYANGKEGSAMNSPVRLMALEARSGAVVWSRAVHPYIHVGMINTTPGTLTLNDGVLLNGINFLGYDGFDPHGSLLSAYDAATGQQLWRDNTPSTGISWNFSDEITPLGGDGVVYLVGLQSALYIHEPQLTCLILCPGVTWLYAINVHTGASWWRIPTGYFNVTEWLT